MSRSPLRKPPGRPARLSHWVLLAVLVLAAPAATAAETLAAAGSVRDLAVAARRVVPGGTLFVSDLVLEPGAAPEALELERFQVLTPDARLVVHGAGGTTERALPDRRFFRGRVAGAPDSLAVLAVGADGAVRGVVQRDGRFWVLGHRAAPATAGPRRLEAAAAATHPADDEPFTCGQEDLSPVRRLDDATSRQSFLGAALTTTPYTARVAVETDYEFYQKFNDVDAATAYITDVIAYASAIYDDELDTNLQVPYVSLWTTSAAADPWTQSGTTCTWLQMGKYWNDNRSSVSRTIAHFFSGRSSNSGIAWVGVLCDGQFFVDHGGSCPGLSPQVSNYGGGYSFSGGLDANFDIDNPSVVWDIVVVSHEIGHTFNSPHTHCYNGLGGSAQPVDECYNGQASSGCFAGTESLPCGTAGAGCGTIMSYCHLLFPGLSNISLTLGAGHPYGVLPDRVPERMRAHVESVASGSSCLDRIQPPDCHQLTLSHSGSGADPVASPASSGGCDPGFYLDGEAIALTADPADGWSVQSWSGTDDDPSLSKFNGLTMPAADHAVSVAYQSGCTDLTLSSGSDSGVETYDVCGTITAGGTYHVTGTGDVTMISRERVVLTDGFRVESGGTLAVEVNP